MSEARATERPWAWISDQALVGAHGFRPVVLIGRALRQRGEDGSLVKFNANSPDAKFIVEAANSHDALVARNKKLEAAIQNALISFAICKLPQLDASVASKEELLKITEAGLRAALTEEK